MGIRDDRLAQIAASLKGGYVTAEQLVESFVRAAIEKRVYRPGERITQDTIARALGVSRIPVRAGLRQLESEGLVTVVPHRGATVVSISASDVAEVFELRKVLECHLLECAMPHLSDDNLRALAEIAAQFETAPDEDYGRLQVAFYEELYSCARRPRAMKILVGLRMEIERYRLSGRVIEDSCHSELLAHLLARDLDATQAWLRRHLDVVSKAVQAIVEPDSVEVSESELSRSRPSLFSPRRALAATSSS